MGVGVGLFSMGEFHHTYLLPHHHICNCIDSLTTLSCREKPDPL